MEASQVRKGIRNAKLNQDNSNILFGEIVLISIGIGLANQSWWWGGGALIGFLVTLNIKPIALLLMFALSLVWGVIGCGIGSLFESTGAMVVLSIIGFLCGLGVHLSALEWTQDA
ncbi:hypothetical protein F0262_23810 [Vibrio rotiferianus]|uniref:Uncharacterized protein n=1 Tax=Vibrio rotiferianus TaxID=190895 RepID=A0A7Y3ZFB3_9VIBR|nr:hypothetical protein [Vibrio rotiferianus]NOH51050.1 hypothetical protein [Vibrio rotiferianus]